MSKITVVINTKNAANTLVNCLRSVEFADEIIVADMNSHDETRSIAKKFHATIVTVPDSNHVEEVRNQSIAKASSPWVLVVDADETIPSKLGQKLNELAADSDSGVSVYRIARMNIVFGAWIKHSGWWPDYQIRFFKRGSVFWSGHIHQQPTCVGTVKDLPANSDLAIKHDNYKTIDEYFERMQRYTRSEVQKDDTSKPPAITSTIVITSFFDDFFRRYYQNEGYKDGLHGTSLAFLQSSYQVVTKLRIWEKQQFTNSSSEIPDHCIRQLLADWQYWQADKMARQSRGFPKLCWLVRKKLRF